jgi:hypothetical protein
MEDDHTPWALEWPVRIFHLSDPIMTGEGVYTRQEVAGLARNAREGRPLICPRCGEPLQAEEVPPRSEVAYVRSRIWWVCPECRRSAILEDLSSRRTR